jgi:hypothetical protein
LLRRDNATVKGNTAFRIIQVAQNYQLVCKIERFIQNQLQFVWESCSKVAYFLPEPTARSAVPGEGTNSARLFTPEKTKALAKSEVHQ